MSTTSTYLYKDYKIEISKSISGAFPHEDATKFFNCVLQELIKNVDWLSDLNHNGIFGQLHLM
jgi:hypothetical protein